MSEPDDIAKKIAKGIESAEIVVFPRAQRPPSALQTLQPSSFETQSSSAPQDEVRLHYSASPSPAAAPADDGPRSGQEKSSRPGGPEAETGGKRDGGDDGDGQDLDLKLSRYPLTDLGNAERFRDRNKGKLLYCPEIGWLYWDGKRYASQGSEEIVKLREHECVRAIQDEARALEASEKDWVISAKMSKGEEELTFYSSKVFAWGRASEGASRMGSISKRACAMLSVDVHALDADPMKINVANGTLIVSKSEDGDYITLKPHDAADLITKLAPVIYDPDAAAPTFKAFLDEIQPPDADDGGSQRLLAQWFGYSLTGDTGEQKLMFFYGKGGNGKGVLVNLMSEIAGHYATSIGIETFLDSGRARSGGQATPDIAKLPGVRMLTTSEPKKGATIDDGFVKLITGGDPIDARHLNKDFFSFAQC